jgi:hypothetical protein
MQTRPLVEQFEDPDSRESISQLLSQLANNSANLVRDEIALARQEINERVKALSLRLIVITAGVITALFGIAALIEAAVIGLGRYLGPAVSSLIIGVVLLAAGVIAALVAVNGIKNASLKPVHTIETLEEDKKWLKEQLT